jgi:DNA (cytosine-5)-methyltransferase 1
VDDISNVNSNFLYQKTGHKKIDVLLGGRPCQAFSNAGLGKLKSLGRPGTLDHPLNNLYREFLRLVKEVKPSFFLN